MNKKSVNGRFPLGDLSFSVFFMGFLDEVFGLGLDFKIEL